MRSQLYMVEIRPIWPDLLSWARGNGLLSAHEPRTDLGYLTHAWLRAAYGDLAPKPFRIWGARCKRPRILGYARNDAECLIEHARSFADPSVLATLEGGSNTTIRSKPMPMSWPAGKVLGFETIVAATRRTTGGVEKDALLVEAERQHQKTGLCRETVYRSWFTGRLQPGLRLLDWNMDAFRLVHRMRRTQKKPRKTHWITIPEIMVRGRIRIDEDDALIPWLECGVGRHTAFGYGMVLLLP